MKRKFLVFILLYLSFCLLITGCGSPSPEIPGTDATQDSDKPAEPVIDPEDSEPMADPEDSESDAEAVSDSEDTEPEDPDTGAEGQFVGTRQCSHRSGWSLFGGLCVLLDLV